MSTRLVKSDPPALATDVVPSPINPLISMWERWRIIAACAAIGILIGYIYYRVATPIYTATCRLMATDASHAVNADGTRPNNLYTQTSIITSWSTIAAGIANLQDPQWYWDCGYYVIVDGKPVRNEECRSEGIRPPPDQRIPMPRGAKAPLLKALQQSSDPVGDIMGATTSDVGTHDMTISISVETEFGDEAAMLANAIAQAYLSLTSNQKHGSADAVVGALGKEHQQLQHELESKNQALTAMVRENPMLYLNNEKSNPTQQRIDALSTAMTSANVALIDATRSYDAAVRASTIPSEKLALLFEKGTLDGEMITPPGNDEQEMKTEIHLAARQLAEYAERYGRNHPAMIAARARVDQLNAAYILLLKARKDAENERFNTFQRSFDEANRQQQELNAKLAQYTALLGERDDSERLMSAMYSRMKDVRIDDDVSALNVRLLEAALRPYVPTRPLRMKDLQYGLVLGVLVGLGLAFIDPKIRSVADITGSVNLPVLSCIPRMRRRERSMLGQVVRFEPSGDVAEAFRTLRSTLSRDADVHTILVTSATRGEGKSTVASNLAIALATLGRKVLLIDADLRDPVQHTIFPGTEAAVGISQVLDGHAKVREGIAPTPIHGLDLLPCGKPPVNAAELIDSEAFADLLATARDEYDIVLLDSPPVLPVTDARILGQLADATVLVVRAEKTSRQTAIDAVSALTGYGAHVLGVASNAARRTRRAYRYYGGYPTVKAGSSKARAVAARAERLLSAGGVPAEVPRQRGLADLETERPDRSFRR